MAEKSKIPEKYHSKMIPLLSHFAEEYLTSAQHAYYDKPSEFATDCFIGILA